MYIYLISKNKHNEIKIKDKNTRLSEQFQTPIEQSISLTQIHDHPLSCHDTGTSIKSGRDKYPLHT